MSTEDLIESDFIYDTSAQPSLFPFLRSLDLDQDVNRRLSGYLNSLRYGNSDIYVSPLGDGIPPESILESWDSIFNSNLSEMNDVLVDLELSNRSKFGPRSICKPWVDRLDGVDQYYEGFDHEVLSHAALPQELKFSSALRPLTLENTLKYIKNNTNSGLPYFTRKSKVKDRLLYKFKVLLSRKDPCILFTRTQEGDKTRNVWGFPIADTTNEMRFYQPVLNFQKRLSWRAALRGPEEVDKQVTRIIDTALLLGLVLISIDFSSFDTSVGRDLQLCSFSYIKNLFQKQYHEEIDYICDRFGSIGLLTPDGIKSGYHGVPSGSTFTNEVDSISQAICAALSGVVNLELSQIQGDDGLYAIKASDADKLYDAFKTRGLKVNVEKGYEATDYCVYLQSLYHVDYRGPNNIIGGIYPTYRALNRIIYQERWSDFEDFGLSGRDYYSIRTISILENCKHHPLFKSLVKFIYNLDKYSLSYSDGAISKYVKMLNNSSGTGGFLNNQYGDGIGGINNFETVKVIKGFA